MKKFERRDEKMVERFLAEPEEVQLTAAPYTIVLATGDSIVVSADIERFTFNEGQQYAHFLQKHFKDQKIILIPKGIDIEGVIRCK